MHREALLSFLLALDVGRRENTRAHYACTTRRQPEDVASAVPSVFLMLLVLTEKPQALTSTKPSAILTRLVYTCTGCPQCHIQSRVCVLFFLHADRLGGGKERRIDLTPS